MQEREHDRRERGAGRPRDGVDEGDPDRLARGEADAAALGRSAEERLEGVALVTHFLDAVVEHLAGDGQRERAEAAGAEDVLAALARGEGAPDLDAVECLVGDTVRQVAADPLHLAAGKRARTDDAADGVAADGLEGEPLVGGAEFVAGIGPDGVGRGGVRKGGGEAVERGDDPLGEDGGGAAAQDARVAGRRADEGELAELGGVDGEGVVLVAQEDERRDGHLAGQRLPVDRRRRFGDDGRGAFQGADAGGEPQDVAYGAVDGGLGGLARPDRVGERVAETVAGPGMATSRPPSIPPVVERAAVQSETTKPSKPHSPRSTSFWRWRCSVMVTPLTWLYAAMTPQGRAFLTMASKGARYSSRSGRGSMTLSTVKRSVSASLATKCLTVAPTPPSWTPRT